MIIRLILLTLCLMLQWVIFSQTFDWNSKETGGKVSFENSDIIFLLMKFEKEEGSTRAIDIYNNNLKKFQNELLELLNESKLNYKLISSNEVDDSTYSNLEKHPIIIDHGLHSAYAHNSSLPSSFLHLYLIERKLNLKVRVKLNHQTTKYLQPYKKFIRRVLKGKPLKIQIK